MASCERRTCCLGLWSRWLLSTKQSHSARSLAGRLCTQRKRAAASAVVQEIILFRLEAVHPSLSDSEDWCTRLGRCSCGHPYTSSEINALPSHSQNPRCSWGKCCLAALPPMRNHTPLTGRATCGGRFNTDAGDREKFRANIRIFGPPITLFPWVTPLPCPGGLCQGTQSPVGGERQQGQNWNREDGQRTPPHSRLLCGAVLRRCYAGMRSNREAFSWIATVIKIIKDFLPG